MKIVSVFLNPYSRTGGQRRYLELTTDLAAKGHEIFLIQNQDLTLKTEKVTVIPLPSKNKKYIPLQLEYLRIMKTHGSKISTVIGKADWIMIHGETNLFAALYLKKLLGANLFYALRSNGIAESEVYQKVIAKHIISKLKWKINKLKHILFAQISATISEHITLQSEFDKKTYLTYAPKAGSKVSIIPGNIGPPRFQNGTKNANQSKDLRKVLFVGNFGVRKGFQYLLESFIELIRSGLDLELIVVGGGELEDIHKKKIQGENLLTRIHFVGRVTDPFPLISTSDLLVVPSLFDSFPDTVLEALHCGTPVIGSRVGGIPDMIGNPELIFEPGDSKGISNIITSLYYDPTSYHKAKVFCQQQAKVFEFDWVGAFEKTMLEN